MASATEKSFIANLSKFSSNNYSKLFRRVFLTPKAINKQTWKVILSFGDIKHVQVFILKTSHTDCKIFA